MGGHSSFCCNLSFVLLFLCYKEVKEAFTCGLYDLPALVLLFLGLASSDINFYANARANYRRGENLELRISRVY